MAHREGALAGEPVKPMPVKLLGWRPLVRNTLRGFADVRLGKSLVIHEIGLHAKGPSRWCGLPGKPQIDGAGNVRRGTNGKPLYVPILEWADKAAATAFSHAVVAAVLAEHPDALDGEAQP